MKIPFKPRAQILLQLGEQLIKNENIAVLELVKNSYDADAQKVIVEMLNIEDPSEGTITISDDGVGMDIDIVTNVWMEPGNIHKKYAVQEKRFSALGRVPIGEKGIGRFGVHKLGREIQLITRARGKKEVFLEIDWDKFDNANYLSDIDIQILERDPEVFTGDKTGTIIKINRLSTVWTRGMLRDLHRAIMSLNSPFMADNSFKVVLKTDHRDWLAGLIRFKDIKDYALFTCDISINNDVIENFEYNFTPYTMMRGIEGRKVSSSGIPMRKKVGRGKNSFQDISLDKYKIGKVSMRLYVYDRDTSIMNNYIPDKTAFKTYLNENGGISVFRNNLRVFDYGEPGNDWLGLDLKRVNDPSKNISNNIVLGAIYLDRLSSGDLIEKANREGFVENEAYDCFRDAVLFAIGQFTAQRNIDKERLRISEAGGVNEPVITAINDIRETIASSEMDLKTKKQLEKSLGQVEKEFSFLKQRYVQTANAGMSYGIVIHEIEKIIGELKIAVTEKGTSIKIKSLSQHLSSLINNYTELLRNKKKTDNHLKDIIDKALFSVEYRLNAHNIEVISDYKNYTDTDIINCASNMLVGAIINIIDNSIYWTTYSKVDKKKIYVSITNDIAGYIGIVIADNGIGYQISGEDAIKPFVSTKMDGLGLGLNIVNEIMLSQNGLIIFPTEGDINIPSDFERGAVTVLAFVKEGEE